MNHKTQKTVLVSIIILTFIVLSTFIYTLIEYISSEKELTKELSNEESNITQETNITTGNDNIVQVDEDSSIRIITEFDENMFKGHKSLIFFWASWCTHCQDELSVLKTALSDYQNRGYKIYLISHDYKVEELTEFMRNNDLNYEVYFDETRIIRKNLNPEASSVPLTYILDENVRLIATHGGTISLEELNNLINTNM